MGTHLNRHEVVMKTSGAKDRFQHQWVLDPNVAYCRKTGHFSLLYEESVGTFCLFCKKHNAVNLQNKFKKFNTDLSVRFKRTAIKNHGNSQQHKASVEGELTRRSSAFQKQVEKRKQSRDNVYHNALPDALLAG